MSDLLIAGIEAAGLVESKRTAWLELVPAWADAIRARLLSNPASSDLAALAHDLGYCSQSHLGAVFRREVGVTLAQARAALCAGI